MSILSKRNKARIMAGKSTPHRTVSRRTAKAQGQSSRWQNKKRLESKRLSKPLENSLLKNTEYMARVRGDKGKSSDREIGKILFGSEFRKPISEIINDIPYHQHAFAPRDQWIGLDRKTKPAEHNETMKTHLQKMQEIHDKKAADYSEKDNRYSNFEYAEIVARPFAGIDKVFATLIGIKLARIAELRKGKIPNNESLDDSFLDKDCYAVLWSCYRKLNK